MNTINNYIVLIVLVLPSLTFSQKVENIRFEQAGKQIHIYYDLEGEHNYNITVYCSGDSGNTWGNSLFFVTGEVGNNQQSGNDKKIIWDVLEETGELKGDIIFKINVFVNENGVDIEHQRVIVHSNNGNIYAKFGNKEIQQLTFSGVDVYPILYDDKNVIFYRKTGEVIEYSDGIFIGAKIIMLNVNDLSSKVLVTEYKDWFDESMQEIGMVGEFILSPDKKNLYFEITGSSVAQALAQYSFKKNAARYITHYNFVQIIKTGKYKNYLLVYNSYFELVNLEGRKWQWFLKNDKGKIVKELGNIDNAKKFLNENSLDTLDNY